MKPTTLFDRIGPDALRAVLTDFYARVFADVMIGFLFRSVNRRITPQGQRTGAKVP